MQGSHIIDATDKFVFPGAIDINLNQVSEDNLK